MKVQVEGFGEGENIPRQFSCDGGDRVPSVHWSGEPDGTMSFALIMDDPDAPAGTWNHWLVWDIPAETHSLDSKAEGTQGTNDFGNRAYGGPCPPRGGGAHRYYFRVYALSTHTLGLHAGAKRAELDRAIKDHVIGSATSMGRYERK